MLTRNGISIQLIHANNGEECQPYQPDLMSLDRRDSSSTEVLSVSHGDIFFVRIIVSEDFEWYESNILAVSIRYDRDGGDAAAFKFPWIVQPAQRETLTIDLKSCAVWDARVSSWLDMSSQFWQEPIRPMLGRYEVTPAGGRQDSEVVGGSVATQKW